MRKDNSHFQALKPWCNLQWDSLRASTHPSVLPIKFQEVFHRTNFLLFFFFQFFFNWRITASQCCGVLCHISMKISHNFIYISPPCLSSPTPFHSYRSSQSNRLGSLYYTAASCQLSILHMIVCVCTYIYMYICYFLNLSYPALPLLCPPVHSLLCISICSL